MSKLTREIKQQITYTESFKKMLVEEYDSGTESMSSIQKKYYIKGKCTLSNWIKKYGKPRVLPEIVKVTMDNEYHMKESKIKALEARVSQLEKALADEHLAKKCVEAEFQAHKEILGEIVISEVEKKSPNIKP